MAATYPERDSLSIPATLIYRLGLPLATGTLYLYSPTTALAVPFVVAPTATLLWQRSKTPREKRPGNLETIIWTFLGAATIAPAASVIVQAGLSYGCGLLIFGERTGEYIKEMTRSADEVRSLPPDVVSKRASMARSWPYLAYLSFFSFSIAGLPEETMKYAILKYIQHRHHKQGRKIPLTSQEYMLYATTIGLGFSFLENLGFIYAAATGDTPTMLLVTAAERILYGTAAHVFTSLLTGARLARASQGPVQTQRWYQIILPSTLYHGAGNAALLGACAFDGHPGFVHPQTVGTLAKYLVAPLALMTGLGAQIGREARTLGVGWFGI